MLKSPSEEKSSLDEPQALTVAVIIPHYNDLVGLDKCMRALRRQSITPSEIIICDNGSKCSVTDVEEICMPEGRVITEKVVGAASARNTAVLVASSDIFAFVDADCVPDGEWLAFGCKALEKADLVGGAVELSFLDSSKKTAVEAFEAHFAFNNRRYIEKENFSVTANLFVRRGTFFKIGNFRNGVPEDKDWGQRAFALGYRWAYAPGATVVHPARRTWKDLSKKWQRLTNESYNYSSSKIAFILRSVLSFSSLPIYIFLLFRSNKLYGCKERFSASVVLVRLRFLRLKACLWLVLGWRHVEP